MDQQDLTVKKLPKHFGSYKNL